MLGNETYEHLISLPQLFICNYLINSDDSAMTLFPICLWARMWITALVTINHDFNCFEPLCQTFTFFFFF